jgi:Xaa-Pro aminopeptidase
MLSVGLDAVLVYGSPADPANVRYLTNYESWWGHTFVVVPLRGEVTLITNALFHGEPMHSGFHTTWVADARPVPHPHSTKNPPDVGDVTGRVLHERGVAAGAVGVAGERVLPGSVERALRRSAPAATWRSADHLLARMRRIKSPREIEVYRAAGKATDAGFLAAIACARPGVTEFEIAAKMVEATIAAGARPRAGGTVQTGARTSLKNTAPSHRVVREGDLLFLDNPASVGGYWTDAARNIVVGKPSTDVHHMLETVLEQNERLQEAIRPGARICDLQQLMRGIAERAGLGEWDYTELCCAHSGGLSLVEEPMWWWGNPEPLEPGMTFYLEPMIIRHGVGTACTEDVILVTEDGCESLTTAPRRNW